MYKCNIDYREKVGIYHGWKKHFLKKTNQDFRWGLHSFGACMTWTNKGEHPTTLHADSVNRREHRVQTKASLPIDKGGKTERLVPFARRVWMKGNVSSAKLAKDACSPFAEGLHADANV